MTQPALTAKVGESSVYCLKKFISGTWFPETSKSPLSSLVTNWLYLSYPTLGLQPQFLSLLKEIQDELRDMKQQFLQGTPHIWGELVLPFGLIFLVIWAFRGNPKNGVALLGNRFLDLLNLMMNEK